MVDSSLKSASHLLLACDREPLLPEAEASASAGAVALGSARPGSNYLWDDRSDPEDLRRQRWGVIAPEGPVGDRLLAAIRPLIARRRELTGAATDVIHRLPPAMDAAAAIRWYKAVFEPGDAFRDAIPRYVLILGDLDRISLEVQQIVGATAFVGRLAFDDEGAYAAYAAKVLAAEGAAEAPAPPLRLLAIDDGTQATAAGRRGLIEPGAALLRRAGLEIRSPEEELDVDGLLGELRGAPGGVLLSVSHGVGAPRRGWADPALQRRRQGAMSLGEGGELTAEAIGGLPLLEGGLWFMLACFSAGTPATSAYAPWLEVLARGRRGGVDPRAALHSLPVAGSPPFIAALPKAALAAERGPLAFIGHVDLAWTYAFRETHDTLTRGHPARFMAPLRAAQEGARVGVAFRELYRYFEQANTELSTLPATAEDRRRGALWMLRQDLAGYVLLGDPAVRLAGHGGSGRADQPTIRRPNELGARPRDPADRGGAGGRPSGGPGGADRLAALGLSFAGGSGTPRPGASSDRAPAPPIELIEEAVARTLLGEPLAALAGRRGVDLEALRRAVDTYRRAGRFAIAR